jgi:hypothetical protein
MGTSSLAASQQDLERLAGFSARLQQWTTTDDPGPLLAECEQKWAIRGALPPDLEVLRALLTRLMKSPSVKGLTPEQAGHPLLALLAHRDGWEWPWNEPEALVRALYNADPEEALSLGRSWATLARTVAPVFVAKAGEDNAALRWLDLCMGLRPRPYWLPAACAIGELCAGALASSAWASRWVAACAEYADDKGGKRGTRRVSKRHALVVAIVASIKGDGSFAGQGLESWRSHIGDADDASAVAAALLLIHQVDLAAEALLRARDRYRKTITYQVWKEVRRILQAPFDEQLSTSNREALIAWLLDAPPPLAKGERSPVLVEGEALLEDLYDAGRTLRWLRMAQAACPEREARLRTGRLGRAPEVAAAVDVSVMEWTPRMRTALSRLDPSALEAVPKAAQIIAFAEVFTLLDSPHAVGLQWRDIAGPSLRVPGTLHSDGGPAAMPTSAGPIEQVGWSDVNVLAIAHNLQFEVALHQQDLDAPVSDSAKNAPADVTGARVQGTAGIRRLVAARWSRASVSSSTDAACWFPRGDTTKTVATHIVRRCMRARDDGLAEQTMSELILAMIAADNPPYDMGMARRNPRNPNSTVLLWAEVQAQLPDTPLGSRLRQMTSPALAMEIARLHGDDNALEAAFGDLLTAGALSRLGESIRATHERARGVARSAPRVGDDVWTVGTTSACASPSNVRDWWRDEVCELAEMLQSLALAASRELHEHDEYLRAPLRKVRLSSKKVVEAPAAVADIIREEPADVVVPLASESLAIRWENAIRALRKLGGLQPWHVEHQLDIICNATEAWLATARRNEVKRLHLVDQLEHAMAQGHEDAVLEALEIPTSNGAEAVSRQVQLLDKVQLLDTRYLRAVGAFFLRRLNFRDARKLAPYAQVPSGLSFYWPIVLGVIGGPLTAIQTDKIWAPLVDTPHAGGLTYWTVVLLMFGACVLALVRDVRRRLYNMDVKPLALRCILPFVVLFGGNFLVNFLVYEVAGAPSGLPCGWTVLLWSSLSMYLGIFFGLMAQGARIDDGEA